MTRANKLRGTVSKRQAQDQRFAFKGHMTSLGNNGPGVGQHALWSLTDGG